MTEENSDLTLFEPRLRMMLAAYRVVPERNPESARRTKARFMAEVDNLIVEQQGSLPVLARLVNPFAWLTFFARLMEGLFMLTGRRVISYAIITLIIIGVFLSGSAGITAFAAGSSLPGDLLYPLKITIENSQAGLTLDSAAKARLHLDFAARRLSEMQSLIDDGRYDDIAQAASEFEREVQKALNATESLSQIDPARAASLYVEMIAILRGYGDILAQMMDGVPVDVQPVIQHAINASKSAAGDDDDDDDDNGSSSQVPTKTPVPDVTMTPTPAITPTSDATATQPAPAPGGGTGGGGDDGGGDDDDDDDDDDADDDDDDD